jgi:5-formyltetrahydrofolate cyclo-ligase
VQGWEEVRAWRRSERAALLARRSAMSRDERKGCEDRITALIGRSVPELGQVRSLGFYWPFKGEYDPRPLARSLHAQGMRLALPVVVERARPVEFRAWWPGMRLTPGVWGIPVPAEGEPVLPEALLVPLLGFDGQGYRLGYGGGYYDRTLAAMPVKPLAVGIGFEMSCLPTIHPQPHDVPMDLIVTEHRAFRAGGAAAGEHVEEGRH